MSRATTNVGKLATRRIQGCHLGILYESVRFLPVSSTSTGPTGRPRGRTAVGSATKTAVILKTTVNKSVSDSLPAVTDHSGAVKQTRRVNVEIQKGQKSNAQFDTRNSNSEDGGANMLQSVKRMRPEEVKPAAEAETQEPAAGKQLHCDGFQIVAMIRVGGKTVKGVVDTGESRSAISMSKYRDLREQGKWSGARSEITLVNGSTQKSEGNFEAEIRFGGRIFQISFMILTHVSGGILLGMDFLAGANSTLRCGELELDITPADNEESHVSHGSVPIGDEKEEPSEDQNSLGWNIPAGAHLSAGAIDKIQRKLAMKRYGKQMACLIDDGAITWRVTISRANLVKIRQHKPS